MILKIFTSGPLATHSYLIGCKATRKAVIIDTPQGVVDPILKAVKHYQLAVKMILLTHSHWDHIVDAAILKNKLHVPLYIHSLDQQNLIHPGSDHLPLFFAIEGAEPDGFLQEGDHLHLGHLTLRVIETPGHTPGGVCFWLPQEKILFSGDTLFQGSMGNLNLPTANPSSMCSSLKKLANLPPETKVYPGHGPPTTLAAEAWIERAQIIFGGES